MLPSMSAFDPDDPAFVDDPYPAYARLRTEDPVAWWEPGGMWLLSRHADVNGVLRDRRFGRVFVPRQPLERFAPWNLVNEHAMLELEPPDHTRLRQLVAREFTPRRVEALRPRIVELTDALLDELAAAAAPDLMACIAEPLPVAVIAELLGFPAGDRHLLRPWSNAIVALYELSSDEAVAERAVTAAAAFDAYLRALIADRRRRPGDDLLSALSVMSVEGDRLTEDELVATAVLLLNAGHEASVNVIGNGVVALCRQRDQWERLRAQPALVRTAVDELIRYDTPLSLFLRTAFADAEIGGQAVRAGERVGVLLGSANRDADVFDRPDVVDVGRADNPHVGFGAGIHFCLGAPLARLELEVALGRLVARFPDLGLAAEPTRRPTYQFRGYTRVPVVV
jgi:cytochrome P450